MFIAGSLPATAIAHLRSLALLGMIGQLVPTNILNKICGHSLLTANNMGSWFIALCQTSQQYSLPDPLIVLQRLLSKLQCLPRFSLKCQRKCRPCACVQSWPGGRFPWCADRGPMSGACLEEVFPEVQGVVQYMGLDHSPVKGGA